MPQPKFQPYKHIKIGGKWRYCRAAVFSNNKIKPMWSLSADEKRSTKKAPAASGIRTLGSTLGLETQRLRSKLLDQVEYKDEKP